MDTIIVIVLQVVSVGYIVKLENRITKLETTIKILLPIKKGE